jgi:hypothetical protein
MVTTGARAPHNTHPTAPLDVAYWVQFQRGDFHGGPAYTYTSTYGFDWVEWKRNSANNPATAYDDLVRVMGKHVRNLAFCYDFGLPGIPAQPATATQPAIPAKPGIPPRYAPVTGLYKQRYEDELHKGYAKRIVQGNDYYVPWLSLRPHQTVQLKLEVEFLNKNPVQPTNLFTVAAHPDYVVTIAGKTNAAPMQLVPKNKQVLDVTVESLRPSAATSLRVEDEHQNLVGELQIADNTLVYELPLRVVYVLQGLPMNPRDPIGTTPPRPLYAPPGKMAKLQQAFEALNFIDYLNHHALNQALITCVQHAPPPPSLPTPPQSPPLGTPPPSPPPLAPAYQLLIDEDQWRAAGYLSSGVLQKPDELPAYCEQLATAHPAIGPFNGITIFVHELSRLPSAAGPIAASGSILPVDAKTLTVYQDGIIEAKPSTLAHVLGHVLGLKHSFLDTPATTTDDDNAKIQAVAQKLAELQAMVPGATPSGLQNVNNNINRLTLNLRLHQNNPFKFTQFSTENLMDYEQGAATTRLSYWHWQWALLQADVAAYHGTTTAAQ